MAANMKDRSLILKHYKSIRIDVTDGKPRVIKFRMINKKAVSKNLEQEEEIEIDREQTQFTDLPGFQEKCDEKRMLLNILSDLSSETIVLLGTSKLDEKVFEEQMKKNLEWEKWKEERGIDEWEPQCSSPTPSTSSSKSPLQKSNNTPVSKKGKKKPNLLEKWISNSATKKGGGKGKSSTPGGKSLQREKCPECSNLIAKKNFIRHKLTCSGSKEGESLQCKECGGVYTTQSSLRYHMKSHMGMSSCSHCDQSFSTPGNLFRHRRTAHSL